MMAPATSYTLCCLSAMVLMQIKIARIVDAHFTRRPCFEAAMSCEWRTAMATPIEL